MPAFRLRKRAVLQVHPPSAGVYHADSFADAAILSARPIPLLMPPAPDLGQAAEPASPPEELLTLAPLELPNHRHGRYQGG